MAAAPGPTTDADVVSTMCRILAHAPDAAGAPAPVNIPHRLLREVRPFHPRILLHVADCAGFTAVVADYIVLCSSSCQLKFTCRLTFSYCNVGVS